MKLSASRIAFCFVTITTIGTVSGKKVLKGLCETDCDYDKDCAPGLWCADEHKAELKKAGFDGRKANCGPGPKSKKTDEVCFDPKILKKSSGGGGGK